MLFTLLSCHSKQGLRTDPTALRSAAGTFDGEILSGEFHSRQQERATLTLLIDGKQRFYGEVRRYGFSLGQFSFDGLTLAFRDNDTGVLTCEKNGQFSYLKQHYDISIKPNLLSEVISKNRPYQDAQLRIEWSGEADFAIGKRANLLTINDEFFWRIDDWKKTASITDASFNIGNCP